jgi:hypothetical protein
MNLNSYQLSSITSNLITIQFPKNSITYFGTILFNQDLKYTHLEINQQQFSMIYLSIGTALSPNLLLLSAPGD